MFVMLTGQRTTLHTDKCTDRIIRLCTSVALDGLNLTEKRVVCIVSILKYLDFPLHIPEIKCKKKSQLSGFGLIMWLSMFTQKAICFFLSKLEGGHIKHHLNLGTDL